MMHYSESSHLTEEEIKAIQPLTDTPDCEMYHCFIPYDSAEGKELRRLLCMPDEDDAV